MGIAQLPQSGSNSYATRDKIIVLSLAAEFGTESWAKIADFLDRHGQAAIQRTKGYTQQECLDIYNDAVGDTEKSTRPEVQGSALSEALYRLKNQRLDEIQHGLKIIAEQQLTEDASEQSGQSAAPVVVADVKEEVQADRDHIAVPLQVPVSEVTQPQALATGDEPKSDKAVVAAESEKLSTSSDYKTATDTKPVLNATDETDAPRRRHDDVIVEVIKRQDLESPVSAPQPRSESIEQEHNAPSSTAIHTADIEAGTAEKPTNDNSGSSSPASKFEEDVESNIDAEEPTGDDKAAALAADEQQLKNWKKNITMVWREISGHRFGSMFLGPIKSADAPHYYEVIRKPLDLKAIKNRIRDEEITTTVEFYRDIMHVLMNALMYNAEDTEVYQMAMEMLPDAQACIEQLLQTEAAVNQPKDGSSAAPADAMGAAPAAKGEDEPKLEDHDGEDSDVSVPTKRKRRIASERAAKHLRD
ncbi:hypothetical protein GGF43_002012 [Coemansia sp. RSA 2618]|nr:hypothetical protein GGF43_002012 [Coemansia sp. RSA 2618]